MLTGLALALLTSIIYGIASDRYGRKPVLLLSMVGLTIGQLWSMLVCMFPIAVFVLVVEALILTRHRPVSLPDIFRVEWTWFCSVFALIGGGGTVFINTLYTTGADVVPVSRR